jgi:hypothetical protein
VGILYFVLVQLNLVGLEPPDPLRYALLALIPIASAGYFWLFRRWLLDE